MTLQMWLLFVALLGLSTALVCPDGGVCEERNTCCQNTAGGYGCCPLPNADCCSDHLHCCYEGTVCDLARSKCVNKTVSLPWVRRLPARQMLSAPQLGDMVQAVICPDRTSECPDDTTCCQLRDGSWGCCPLVKAVCCEDKLHCCPEDTKCDLVHLKCEHDSLHSVPMLEKIPARRRGNMSVSSVRCPGSSSSCPDGFTCCLLTSGDYGCCPYTEAVCCSDHIHCCPANTLCDLEEGVCKSGDVHMPLLKKIPAVPDNSVGVVPCNDSVACPDKFTCCKKLSGDWACCPLNEAVCCDDHLHCCPHGTICNLAASTCDHQAGGTVMPWLSKVPAFPLPSDNSRCDKSTSCPGKSTCCRMQSGDWACCPLPQAVCCDDHVHCCPHGTVCNLETETCDNPTGFQAPLSWVTKVSALTTSSSVKDEKCDKQTRCPVGTTCCKKESGLWACCPLPQAVCCSDHEHCCPQGYICNVAEQTCDRPGAPSLSWLQKAPALQDVPAMQEEAVSSLARPDRNMCDHKTSCPRDTTCCFMAESQRWGCCPLPNAVCCSDGTHCCPSTHTCDPQRASCSKGPLVTPWFTKLKAMTEPGNAMDVKCDDKSSCASGTTCCKLQTGEWGCCPLVKAVCCADHEHCCPQGYSCNMQTRTCEKKSWDVLDSSVPLSRVVQSKPGDVPCDLTGEFRCSEQDTCCRITASEWACCPSPKAVCCSDSKHCCPAGYMCDLQAGGCTRHKQPTWDTLFRDRKTDAGL